MRRRTIAPATFRRAPVERTRPRVFRGEFGRLFLVLGANTFHRRPSVRRRPIRGYRPLRDYRPIHWGLQRKRLWPTTLAHPAPELHRIEATAADLACTDQVELVLRKATLRPGMLAFYEAELFGKIFMFLGHVASLDPDPRIRAKARQVVAEALSARQAILRSVGPEDWKPEVARFARRHLGVRKLDAEWLDAVSMALLGEWADTLSNPAPNDVSALDRLRQEARTVHQQLMPLWERKSGPGRVWMLDYLLPSGEDLHEIIATSYEIEDEALPWEPERKDARAVFHRLKCDEQLVARTYALDGGSWAEAADYAHLSKATGTRVMRKLRRLGLQHQNTVDLSNAAAVGQ
ncbi:hypothetical protein [Streptomyces anulatus]|uniref:hypothetical protein n=1 Tax=Streptomyces anulatus TaxID=1892 RepID=UPI003426B32F|nr:hypothetical protein OG238_00150 [Streptomyces anulatus]WST90425.1 hypothetical protein OG238_41380 [Streptomyces anulatus]